MILKYDKGKSWQTANIDEIYKVYSVTLDGVFFMRKEFGQIIFIYFRPPSK